MILRTLVAVERAEPRRLISRALDALGAISARVESLNQARKRLAVEPFDLVVFELGLSPDLNPGIIQELRELPEAPEVIILIDDDDDSGVRAALLAAGAYAVLSRGGSDEAFQEALTTLAQRRLEESHERLRSVPDEGYRLGDYVTRSPAMQAVLSSARRIAARDTTVLLLGETGVGKGLLARSLHNEGPRADGPFVAMNCGALTETLLEAELFGHEKGAFTGADRARRGYFELAHGGTLFLDEVAEMPLHLQVRLLHVLEERRVRPVGSEKKVEVDVRLIAATNRDLGFEVKEGRFREDLFYRLNVVTLTLPPLRERKEDIAEIAQSYVEHFRVQTGSPAKTLSKNAIAALVAYPWPGNVRELTNAIERAVIMTDAEEIPVEDLPVDVQSVAPEPAADLARARKADAEPGWLQKSWTELRREVLEDTELRYLRGLLAETAGRIGETASRAGMDPRSLHQKMKKYGLRKEDFRA